MRVRPSIKPHAATDGTRVRLPPPPRKLPARIGTATGRVAEQATKATHGKKTAMQFTETEQFVKVTRQYNVVEADEVPFMHGRRAYVPSRLEIEDSHVKRGSYAAARDACRGQK